MTANELYRKNELSGHLFALSTQENDLGQMYGHQVHLLVDKNGAPLIALTENQHDQITDKMQMRLVTDKFFEPNDEGYRYGDSTDLWNQQDFGPNYVVSDDPHFVNHLDERCDKYGN